MQLINRKNIREILGIFAITLTVLVGNAFAFSANDARQPELRTGVLGKYAKLVGSAATGAICG